MALKYAVNNSLSAITSLPSSISGGALNLISTQTASGSASLEFTSGIDSTYDSYVFKFININASNEPVQFQFNSSTDSGSTYAVTKTTTHFELYHDEADTAAGILYQSVYDQAQSTAFLRLNDNTGNASDENMCGTLQVFSPSSSVFVKHFISVISDTTGDNFNTSDFVAGYFNTTSPIDAFKFQVSAGTFDGIIKMYGVS